uniref:splicing factor ESS-2 homolog n=1 Tax=Styela clava TaxID=7725 RepID=UPI00193A9D3C|nr:splicing factor ESS-2 homolog [Styela clava]
MALETYNKLTGKRRQQPQVLDEETYTENLERIITRDFFPDHEKLKDQKEYLEAEEKKDFEKMRQIAFKFSRKKNQNNPTFTPNTDSTKLTPATFDTPVIDEKMTPSSNLNSKNLGYDKKDVLLDEEDQVKQSDVRDGLNSFLGKYTSEDNESFENIMEKAEQDQRNKYSWLYEAELKHAENTKKMLMLQGDDTNNKMLAITDGSENENKSDLKSTKCNDSESSKPDDSENSLNLKLVPYDDEERESRTVDTWTYKNKNHLMYYPEGLPNDDVFKKPYEITHSNTRFANDPFKNTLDRTKLVEAAAENARFGVGERVGHDGKAIIPNASPAVNGYGFVATPSPAPGVNMSPVMTWGVVEGTPIRIDGSGTPTPGPSFKFPKESRRDELTYRMVDENTKKNRAKKQAALRQVKESVLAGTPRRVGTIMSSERINTLSPAAKRLVSGNRKLGIASDIRLKASYTPSPSVRSKRGDLTPISKTPTPNTRSKLTPQVTGAVSPSITDNLLNIPKKKKKASDFF